MTNPTEYSTGLRIVWDDRSRDYPVRQLFGAGGVPVSRRWPCYSRLDQADPVSVQGVTNDLGFKIYHEAQLIDEWPGENYEGTSVLAGAKIVQRMGYMDEYRWAFGIDDVQLTLSELGPVVFGVPWYQSMFTPNAQGQLTISGVASGGHCILGDELDIEHGRIWLLNQWGGRSWGIDGRAWMAIEDWDKLLRQGGQACVPVKRSDPAGPPPIPPPEPHEETLNERILREMGPFRRFVADIDLITEKGIHWPVHTEGDVR